MRTLILTLYTSLIMASVYGQDTLPPLEDRVMQLTFVHPLGTNGVDGPSVRNNLSLNLFLGVNGGLHGAELGGFGNVILRDAQFLQAAGFLNFVGGHFTGAQAAGFLNIVDESMNGVQGAGFMNIAGNPVRGVQGAGFMNVASRDVEGVQGAGFMNIASGDVRGAQGAGFMNISGDDVWGIQIAGFMNVSATVKGMQAAGFINITDRLDGLALGTINIIDSVEAGVPIGFLSIVNKGGYFRGAIWAGEAITATAAIKTGLSRFYNLFGFGVHAYNNQKVYGPMYGIGTRIGLGNRWKMHLEAHYYQLLNNGWNATAFHSLNRFQVGFEWLWGQRIGMTAGLAWNLLIEDPAEPLPALAPFDLIRLQRNNFNLTMWPGAQVGFLF